MKDGQSRNSILSQVRRRPHQLRWIPPQPQHAALAGTLENALMMTLISVLAEEITAAEIIIDPAFRRDSVVQFIAWCLADAMTSS
jgi:hypothetical protein